MGVCVGSGMHAYARGEQRTSGSLYCSSPYSLEAESFTELRAFCLLTSWQRASVTHLFLVLGLLLDFNVGAGDRSSGPPAEPSPKALFLSSLARTFLLPPIYLRL